MAKEKASGPADRVRWPHQRHCLRVVQGAPGDVLPLAKIFLGEERLILAMVWSLAIKMSCHVKTHEPPMKIVENCKALVQEGYALPGKWEANLAHAEHLLSEALVDDPDNPLLLTCLGAVLCDQGRHEAAAMQLRQAIAHASQDGNALFNLGVALLNSRSGKEAMKFFDKARSFQASPLSWQAYFDPQAH